MASSELDGGYATLNLTNSINQNAAFMNFGESDAMQPTEAADSMAAPVQPQEEMYTPVRVLGKGAFGEAVLYRKTEVS